MISLDQTGFTQQRQTQDNIRHIDNIKTLTLGRTIEQ